ncbi:(Fe-S)-binding protein [Flavobacterium cellulosilyticum]|uniref:(Fe-S)-binding protein n=1 Tax=Flavobacterium cellulosilyticum TaxID=2541731 RepID=A0A4R5CHM6_9FLAO|nr:(Fe-S)-binding protein [Flavobacterium cellulosilyticum]TDD99708.1 (Fe-S)-binding protein [Flavobacterium cellulosilyticum]
MNNNSDLKVVYFPSCINRSMGKNNFQKADDLQLTELTNQLLVRAGFTIIYPESMDSLCCGMPFSSKGFADTNQSQSHALETALLKASENGTYPVLYDMSPCFYHSKEEFSKALKIVDPIEFMLDYVMPHLVVKNKKETISVFPVCSVKKIGKMDQLLALSQLCADSVIMIDSNCCGFAGDRGFLVPELNEFGLRDLKEQIPANCKEGYSTSRTCEIGLESMSGIDFKSIFYLIEEVTR